MCGHNAFVATCTAYSTSYHSPGYKHWSLHEAVSSCQVSRLEAGICSADLHATEGCTILQSELPALEDSHL